MFFVEVGGGDGGEWKVGWGKWRWVEVGGGEWNDIYKKTNISFKSKY